MYNGKLMKKIIKILPDTGKISLLLFCLSIISCSTKISNHETNEIRQALPPKIETLVMTFSGDLMAHDVNFKMKDYNRIYDSVRPILTTDDLSFTNIEMPVCNSKPMSTYPCFNVHSSYLKAAADGGFDVFSLANNHTNDQGISGMTGTLESAEKMQTEFLTKNRKLYFSGVKVTDDEIMHPTLIEYQGWKIQYLSVTELLNSHGKSKQKVYYSEPNAEGRKKLLTIISESRKNTPSDLFILSLHLCEAEYGLKVNAEKKLWFQELAKSGVDIICASHPHVMQTWEIYKKSPKDIPIQEGVTLPPNLTSSGEETLETKNEPLNSAFFMYSMGNFISGQRVKPNYANPNHYREYTGDAVLLQITVKKIDDIVQDSFQIKPIPITVHKEAPGYVVKLFTEDWISTLPETQKKYYSKRLNFMRAYLPVQ